MGQLEGNPLLSWKEDTLFLKNGYETTSRYTFSRRALIQGIFIKMMSEYVQRKDSDTY